MDLHLSMKGILELLLKYLLASVIAYFSEIVLEY